MTWQIRYFVVHCYGKAHVHLHVEHLPRTQRVVCSNPTKSSSSCICIYTCTLASPVVSLPQTLTVGFGSLMHHNLHVHVHLHASVYTIHCVHLYIPKPVCAHMHTPWWLVVMAPAQKARDCRFESHSRKFFPN